MKRLVTFISIAVLAAALTGCGTSDTQQKASAAGQAENTPTTISIIGSTTVQPVAQSIADSFAKDNSAISVEIQGIGSSAGIKAVIDATADIGASSRALKPEEKASGVTEHVLAYDGIAVVVNGANTVADLEMETVKKIFNGEIKNWKEVGGEDADIIVISRESGSGTRDAFEEMVDLTKEENGTKVTALREDALICEGNGAVKASIASKENGIAYLSLGYMDETTKPVSIDKIAPSVETVKSGEYKISRPLLLITKGELSEPVQKYIEYCMADEGQKIVAEKYISIK